MYCRSLRTKQNGIPGVSFGIDAQYHIFWRIGIERLVEIPHRHQYLELPGHRF